MREGACAAYHTLCRNWPTPLLTVHLLIALTHTVAVQVLTRSDLFLYQTEMF